MKEPLAVPPDLHDWAGRNLGVSADAGADEARAAFLRRLPDCQWLPPPELQESQEYWSRPHDANLLPALLEQAIPEEEARLRARIDEFGAQFFELTPRERRERYQELTAQCAWSAPLTARVQALAPALKLPRHPWESAHGSEQALIEQICQVFPLPLAERAERRREAVEEFRMTFVDRHGQSLDPTKFLLGMRKAHPDLVVLEPALLEELVEGEAPARIARRLPKAPPAPTTAPTESSGSYRWGWVVVVIACALARTCSSNDHRPQPQPVRQWAPPPVQQNLFKKFDEDQPAQPKKFDDPAHKFWDDDIVKKILNERKAVRPKIPDPEKLP